MLFVTYKNSPLNSALIVHNAKHWWWKTVANGSQFIKILSAKDFIPQHKQLIIN